MNKIKNLIPILNFVIFFYVPNYYKSLFLNTNDRFYMLVEIIAKNLLNVDK